MKKFLHFLCLFIICVLLLTGCNNGGILEPSDTDEKGSSLDGSNDSGTSDRKQLEYEVFVDRRNRFSAKDFSSFEYSEEYCESLEIPETLKVNVLGKSYEAPYLYRSFHNTVFSPILFSYVDNEQNTFKINEQGELRYWNIEAPFDSENILSKEECVAKAESYFKDYFKDILDISDYKMVSVEKTATEESDDAETKYTVCFKKYVHGIETANQALITVNLNGTPTEVVFPVYPEENFSKIDSSINTVEIDEAFKQAIREIYLNEKVELAEIDLISRRDQKLYVLNDGTIGFMCTVSHPEYFKIKYYLNFEYKMFIQIL